MEEKILIKSERYNIKKFLSVFCILGIIAAIIFSFVFIKSEIHYYNWQYERYSKDHIHNSYCYTSYGELECDGAEYAHPMSNAIESYFKSGFFIALIIIASTLLVSGIVYVWLRSYELTVTNKRVFGKVAFGKRVDLPVDFISAIGTISSMKGVSVSTASGRIKFLVIKNSQKIYDVLNNILIGRQQDNRRVSYQGGTIISSNADELKKFKELLDGGIITQDEFDEKKKQLLGLSQTNTDSYEVMPDNFDTEIENLEDETEQKSSLFEFAEPYKKRLFEFVKEHKKKTVILISLIAFIVSGIFVFAKIHKTSIPTDELKFCDYYGDVILENDDIESAKKKVSNGQTFIELKLSREGQEKFAEATKVISKSKNNYIRVYRDDFLISAPDVTEEINTDTVFIPIFD